ncbi:MAG: translation initiation factor IF-2 [Dehalococcoidia bacterium]|nr:translation initiation factor IF-2 [Dehalococcoidia bacterium]
MDRKTGKTEADVAGGRSVERADARPQVIIPRELTVKQFADVLGASSIEVIKYLMRRGYMVSINQLIDYDMASAVAGDLGLEAKPEKIKSEEKHQKQRYEEDVAAQVPRPPVITIMGHVDHGKTKLLDAIRKTNVVDTEAGNITQHIGAYQVDLRGQKITFLDTPGHQAFTAMRARGARATDIAVLVVAADDGIMPQTIEAISHARAAEVPIVVAINKIDKPEANPERVKQQLAEHGLLVEAWGGDIIAIPVSAKLGENIQELLENLLVVAEVQELKADPTRPAAGVVIEARLDSSKGPLATVLVQTGTLKIGEVIVMGDTWGRVKAMFDDKGRRVKKAEPSMPVAVLGVNSVPRAGDVFKVMSDEKEARILARENELEREKAGAARATRLTTVYAQIQTGQVRELNIVLKTDVQGSLEPIRTSLERLGSEAAKVRLVHAGSGNITENDVMLAIASHGIIIGFNTRIEPGAKLLAESEGVDIRNYQVIYNLVDDVEKALAGLLEPTFADVVEGHAEVRAIFAVKQGKIAGSYVTDGKLTRGDKARVIRRNQVMHDSTIASLRHFKENVKEIGTGFECGIGIDGFADFEIGDIIEAYRKEKVA